MNFIINLVTNFKTKLLKNCQCNTLIICLLVNSVLAEEKKDDSISQLESAKDIVSESKETCLCPVGSKAIWGENKKGSEGQLYCSGCDYK